MHDIPHSPGQPLDDATRAYFEPRFGHDFSQVRVHTDAEAGRSARGLNAHAYTLGRDIVFASGRFDPRSREGQRLFAHELTHVVQQQNAATPVLQRKAGERDVGGDKVAVIPLRWERDVDEADFVDRLVAAVSRTAAFRGVPRDYIRAALMVPGLAFFADHQLRFMTGQSVQLRITASLEDGDLSRMWIETVEPVAPQPAEQAPTTSQKPAKAEGVQPPASQVSLQEADGVVTVSDGRVVSVTWLVPQPDAPDPQRIAQLIRSEVSEGHWEARPEPADDSRLMAFVRSSGEKWFLRRGFSWPRKQTTAAPAPAPTGCSESDPNYAQCVTDEIRGINRNLARICAKGIEIGADPLSTPLSKVLELKSLAEACVGNPTTYLTWCASRAFQPMGPNRDEYRPDKLSPRESRLERTSTKSKAGKGTAPGGRELEIDALDRNTGTVIEIKSDNEYDRGLAEAEGYAQIMDKVEPLPDLKLPDGTTVRQWWKAKCIVYDGGAVGDLHDHLFGTAR